MEEYNVFAINLKTKIRLSICIIADEEETTEKITLYSKIDGQEIIASHYNYLPAYQVLRDKMLEIGYGLLCMGSRINAVQSGMMGANDKVYLVHLAEQALSENIVSLWEYAEIEDFPNTQLQSDFFFNWLESLKQ